VRRVLLDLLQALIQELILVDNLFHNIHLRVFNPFMV